MGNKSTQHYEVDGALKDFDFMVFKAAFNAKLKKGKLNKTKLEEALAQAANVEASTVHNWRGRRNAPSSLDIICLVATFLEVAPEDLLIDHKEQAMEKLTGSQRNAVANVYRDIEDYLYLFTKSDGFVWRDYRIDSGSPYAKYITAFVDESAWAKRDATREIGFVPDETLQLMIYKAARGHVFEEGIDLAEAGYDWVCHSLEREWVELGSHPIYEELGEYIENALLEIWNGKTDPDYRFDPHDENDDMHSRETSVEAACALKGVREIIGRYL